MTDSCPTCARFRIGVANALRRADEAELLLAVARAELAQARAELREMKKHTTAEAFEAATDRGPGEAR